MLFRSSHPEVFLGKGLLEICSKFTGEHLCQIAISIKLQSRAVAEQLFEIALRHGCSPVNLLIFSEHLFLRIPLDGCFWFFIYFYIHIFVQNVQSFSYMYRSMHFLWIPFIFYIYYFIGSKALCALRRLRFLYKSSNNSFSSNNLWK